MSEREREAGAVAGPGVADSGSPAVDRAIVTFHMEVSREDLERNGVRAPEEWEPADAEQADGMGLIYSFGSVIQDAVRHG
jgi:hypothetical protein